MNTTAQVTIEQVYGKTLAELQADPRWPKGKRANFQEVKLNDKYLRPGTLAVCEWPVWPAPAPVRDPIFRIILEDIPSPKTHQVVKFVALDRPLQPNDYEDAQQILDWLVKNQDRVSFEGSGAISYTPTGDWNDAYVIQTPSRNLLDAIREAMKSQEPRA